ncbi:MAG: hypothetical protein HHAS10_02100 [Candidatus Altimarinota bacterium]
MSFFVTLDSLEYPLVKSLQNLDGTLLDAFSFYVSNIALMIGAFGMIIIFMIYKKHRLWKPLLFALIISGITSYLVNEGIYKMLLSEIGIFRPRPWTIHPDILAIGHAFRDSSFPSSHMAFTTLLVIIVTYFEKRFLPFGIFLILLMGLSRVHNGMHYPSDVIIGTIMGIIYAAIGIWIMKKFRLEKKYWWEKLMR